MIMISKNLKRVFSTKEIEQLKLADSKYDTMYKLYLENKDFRRYVDKTCNDEGWRVEFALLSNIVQEVGQYYMKKAVTNDGD